MLQEQLEWHDACIRTSYTLAIEAVYMASDSHEECMWIRYARMSKEHDYYRQLMKNCSCTKSVKSKIEKKTIAYEHEFLIITTTRLDSLSLLFIERNAHAEMKLSRKVQTRDFVSKYLHLFAVCWIILPLQIASRSRQSLCEWISSSVDGDDNTESKD